jgi:hypothetical protein
MTQRLGTTEVEPRVDGLWSDCSVERVASVGDIADERSDSLGIVDSTDLGITIVSMTSFCVVAGFITVVLDRFSTGRVRSMTLIGGRTLECYGFDCDSFELVDAVLSLFCVLVGAAVC